MGKQFEFADFIDEFKVNFNCIPKASGSYAPNGTWQPGVDAAPIAMEGIILPLSNDDRQYVPDGVWTEKDRKIYVTTTLEKGQKIEYGGVYYTIYSEKPYNDYADINIYYARGVER